MYGDVRRNQPPVGRAGGGTKRQQDKKDVGIIREEGEHKGDFAIRAQKTVGKGSGGE